MSKPLELLSKRLSAATEGHGKKAELCRATGMAASQVDSYIKLKTEPTLAVLERLAEYWGTAPWELICPPELAPPPPPPTVEALTKIIEDQERQIRAAIIERPLLSSDELTLVRGFAAMNELQRIGFLERARDASQRAKANKKERA